MTSQTLTRQAGAIATEVCAPEDRSTKSLLGYGVIAGPVYVTVSLAQALTREGFDLARHPWSLLANGDLGWVQVTNLVVTGLMLIAAAVGLRRALAPGSAATWTPRLIAAFGTSLLVAAVFRADPALGFPVGTPDGPAQVTTSGLLHFVAAGVGVICLAVACIVLGRRYDVDGRRAWARFSRVTGAVFLGGFACVASSGGSAVPNLAFAAAVILIFTWVSAVSSDSYRSVSNRPTGP